MAFKILLVEDDAEIREIIIDYFMEKSEGVLNVYTAETGIEGQLESVDGGYDLVLLDVMLPEIKTIFKKGYKLEDNNEKE